jgi:hypothetical protein
MAFAFFARMDFMSQATLESRVVQLEQQMRVLLPTVSAQSTVLDQLGLGAIQALELRQRLLSANPDYDDASMNVYDNFYAQES